MQTSIYQFHILQTVGVTTIFFFIRSSFSDLARGVIALHNKATFSSALKQQ